MWQDFAEYILNEVGDEDVKIAEVGVGKFSADFRKTVFKGKHHINQNRHQPCR